MKVKHLGKIEFHWHRLLVKFYKWIKVIENKISDEANEDIDTLSEQIAYDVISWHLKHNIYKFQGINEGDGLMKKPFFFHQSGLWKEVLIKSIFTLFLTSEEYGWWWRPSYIFSIVNWVGPSPTKSLPESSFGSKSITF